MSDSQTTAAWELRFTDDPKPMPFVCTAGDVVCVPDPNHEQPDVFDAKNFRLIAAAPYLLALLIESQANIGGDWRERRDAVIAKAIGNQQ